MQLQHQREQQELNQKVALRKAVLDQKVTLDFHNLLTYYDCDWNYNYIIHVYVANMLYITVIKIIQNLKCRSHQSVVVQVKL